MDKIKLHKNHLFYGEDTARPGWVSLVGVIVALIFPVLISCGTTKWSDTSRTATEQLLVTSAMEDVVDEFDFYPLTGRRVFLNKEGINCSDSQYLISILRQQLSSNGVLLKDKQEEADYVLEVAPGAVGTNRYDLMYGIPKTDIPTIVPGGGGSSIPEISLIKRTDQKAQVKLALWAYNRKSGVIVWQSGTVMKTASIRDRWFLGLGPVTKSSFSNKLEVGGDRVDLPSKPSHDYLLAKGRPSVRTEAVYRDMDAQALEELECSTQKGDTLSAARNDPAKSDGKKPDTEEAVASSGKPAKKGPEGKDAPSGAPDTHLADNSKKPDSNGPNTGSSETSSPGTIPPQPPTLRFDNMELSLQKTVVPH